MPLRQRDLEASIIFSHQMKAKRRPQRFDGDMGVDGSSTATNNASYSRESETSSCFCSGIVLNEYGSAAIDLDELSF